MFKAYQTDFPESRPKADRPELRKCRDMAGKTQEEMADLLHISVRSLRRYESGEEDTPDDVMLAAATVAECPLALYRHLKVKYVIGDEILPTVEEVPLAQAVVALLDELATLERAQVASKLLALARDGVIDPDEKTDFDFVMEKLDGVRRAVELLRYCRRD